MITPQKAALKAKEHFLQGYTCAQAVLYTFIEDACMEDTYIDDAYIEGTTLVSCIDFPCIKESHIDNSIQASCVKDTYTQAPHTESTCIEDPIKGTCIKETLIENSIKDNSIEGTCKDTCTGTPHVEDTCKNTHTQGSIYTQGSIKDANIQATSQKTSTQSTTPIDIQKNTFSKKALCLDMALKISCCFGGGMGRLREVCGTVSAMFMALGLYTAPCSPPTQEQKAALYKDVQELAKAFKAKNGSIICRDLLGLSKDKSLLQEASSPTPEKRTQEYYKKRPCPDLCFDAAFILAQFLSKKQNLTRQNSTKDI